MANTDGDTPTKEKPTAPASRSSRPSGPAGSARGRRDESFVVDDNRERIIRRTREFENPALEDAIRTLSRRQREGSRASFLDIRTPGGRVDPVFDEALDEALAGYVHDLDECRDDTPDKLREAVRRWVFEKGFADELSRVAQLASRRQSSEARQHVLARFHPALIHELLRANPEEPRADPDDAPGFLEAELFELERDDGALDRVARTLVERIAVRNRRLLTDAERDLAARELRRAL